jgi:hypothetical protein
MMHRWFGATKQHPGFQLQYLDKNSWLQEADLLSFWTRGESRAELLVRTNEPERRIQLTLSADRLPIVVDVELEGRSVRVPLAIGQSAIVQFALEPGFRFKNVQGQISYIWRLAITTDTGFNPADTGSPDNRFLGVRVLPLIIR